MPAAIVTQGLGKRYRLGDRVHYGRLTESIANGFSSLVSLGRHPRPPAGWVWALQDVTLEVEEGEVLGLVGRNGAGKTTLLKLLSRVTEPTVGEARLRGKVGSLLEVGTGFHPELTGRENVYLSGAILGMRRAEIRRKFDEIVEFADIGQFVDTPVKRYSSGMQVRLGFAVAAHLDTEILMVDEVLAVGDAEFQRRCLQQIEDVARGGGRTILFVSHNLQSVRTLCDRAVYLEQGRLAAVGEAGTVVREYLERTTLARAERVWDDPVRRPGNSDIRLVSVGVSDPRGELVGVARSSEPLTVELTIEVLNPVAGLAIGFDLDAEEGGPILSSYQLDAREPLPIRPGRTTLRAVLPSCLLDDGGFVVSPRIVTHRGRVVLHEQGAVRFDVVADHRPRALPQVERVGPLAVPVEWTASATDSTNASSLGP
jgi:lipopolysaccharide transport system ATP-binding protein